MKERLLNNVGLKLLSIFLAFFVWLAVVNVANPEKSDHQDVAVEVLNENVLAAAKQTYEIVGRDSVRINYKVSTRDASLIKASDFHAYIDLADYNVTGSVPVKVEVNSDKAYLINSITPNPMVIKVKTEELQRKRFNLQVNTIGSLEEGYALGVTTLSPEYVYVSGPVSQVGQISQVGIEVDVDGVSSDLSGTLTPVYYDANGNQLELDDKVTLNTQEINYQMTILKVKNLTLDFQVQGKVADGYRFTGVECSTKAIPVIGMKSVLASLTTLTIQDQGLDISGATTDKVVYVDVGDYLPANTTIAGDAGSRIKVTLKVEPLKTQDFVLDTGNITLRGASTDYSYSFDKDKVNVSINGLQEDLETLTQNDLHASIDVSGMSQGSYQGKLTFELGEGFKIMGYSGFNLIISPVEDRTTQAALETSESEESSDIDAPEIETTQSEPK